MKGIGGGVFFALLLSALFAPRAQASTINAPSCSQTDVQNTVNAASPGDTVVVPAGNCSWTTVSLSGVSLIGAGSSTSGTVITSGNFAITKHGTFTTRVSGFRFTGSDMHGSFGGSPSARAYIIDHNYFNIVYGGQALGCAANGGLLYSNVFHKDADNNPAYSWVMACHMGEDWTGAQTLGTLDTQGPNGGERNIYFENNIVENLPDAAFDGDQGARLVVRYNTFRDSSLTMHGGGGQIRYNDTSTTGHRHLEVYNNTFIRTPFSGSCTGGAGVNMNHWVWFRGGTGVVANNAMDVVSNQCYGNKALIRLAVGCNQNGTSSDPNPVPFQIGQLSPNGGVTGFTVPPVENPPSHPVLIFGNTAGPNSNGPADSGFISVQGNGTGGVQWTSCSNPGAYVQVNTEYYLSNQWNWTPFTNPHPLVSGSGPAPNAPSSPRVQ
jgi:hypothetical protein